jgi:DNA-binding transcriptional MerR regulator
MSVMMFKQYNGKSYSMKEVSNIINLPVGTIKQWEKELSGLLVIPRTKQGARYCTDQELVLLKQIKEMREQFLHKHEIRALLEKQMIPSIEPVISKDITPTVPEVFVSEDQHVLAIEESTPEELTETEDASMDRTLEVYPIHETAVTPLDVQVIHKDERYELSIEVFKHELLSEIKKEIHLQQKELLDEIKNELVSQSIQTVQEVSKSIQRSNDKRQGEVQFLTDTIQQVSEKNAEQFTFLTQTLKETTYGTAEQIDLLTNEMAKSTQVIEQLEALPEELFKISEAKLEKLSKQVTQSTLTAAHQNRQSVEKMNGSVEDVKDRLEEIVNVMTKEQRQIHKAMNEIKVSTAKIHQREEQFQHMVSSLREVAAAKSKKRNWWKFWE